jgi:hypothetical protein
VVSVTFFDSGEAFEQFNDHSWILSRMIPWNVEAKLSLGFCD